MKFYIYFNLTFSGFLVLKMPKIQMNMYRHVCAWNGMFSRDPLLGLWCWIPQTTQWGGSNKQMVFASKFFCATLIESVHP